MTTITFDTKLNIKKTHFKNIDDFSYYLIDKNSTGKKVLDNVEKSWVDSSLDLELSENSFDTVEGMFNYYSNSRK